jgi:hypothetical protein
MSEGRTPRLSSGGVSALLYVNAVHVQEGIDDFFVTIGTVIPPKIKSAEDIERYKVVTGKPLFRFAIARSSMESFIVTLQERYTHQGQKTRQRLRSEQ